MTVATKESLEHIKTPKRSTMGQDRLNALLLLYIHMGISFNHEGVIDLLIYIPSSHKKNDFHEPHFSCITLLCNLSLVIKKTNFLSN